MDSLKSWFVNIAAKEMLPSLVRAGLAAANRPSGGSRRAPGGPWNHLR